MNPIESFLALGDVGAVIGGEGEGAYPTALVPRDRLRRFYLTIGGLLAGSIRTGSSIDPWSTAPSGNSINR